jgi:hypothetical protein
MPLDNISLPPILEHHGSEQSATNSQFSLESAAGSAAGFAADSYGHLMQMMGSAMDHVGSTGHHSLVSSTVPPVVETFLDSARGGLLSLAQRIRARMGQVLAFETGS